MQSKSKTNRISFTIMYLQRFSLELEMTIMTLTFPINIKMKTRHVVIANEQWLTLDYSMHGLSGVKNTSAIS
jgi:hypothetical protein